MDVYDVLEGMLRDESKGLRPLPLSLLQTITNNFSEEMKLGRGGFAQVYKVRKTVTQASECGLNHRYSGHPFSCSQAKPQLQGILGSKMIAVKKLYGEMDINETQFVKEIECLMKARHKNIVRFLGYCADTQGLVHDIGGKSVLADVRSRALCFEYVVNGSLDKHITDASRGLEWRVRYKIIKGICEGLHYLHTNHILHLDLKPANILVDDNMVPKIADFGLSRRLDQNQSTVIGITPMGSL
ncbi:hypothetical protein EJB05_05355, partial [Eragrostis curvula]